MKAITRRTFLGASLAVPFVPQLVLGQEVTSMKIRMVFHDQDFTATLEDNVSTRELVDMLPLDLTIADFAHNKKLAYLPRKFNALARGPFPNAAAGDLCYYVPWGNLAFFYDAYESTRDLVRLGRLDGGVEPLLTRGEFPLRIERIQ